MKLTLTLILLMLVMGACREEPKAAPNVITVGVDTNGSYTAARYVRQLSSIVKELQDKGYSRSQIIITGHTIYSLDSNYVQVKVN